MSNIVSKALARVADVHEGQTDKSGVPSLTEHRALVALTKEAANG